MNYRHAFHAGNHADVLKHLTLARVLALLAKKEAPLAYLDSHAGIGLYDLKGDEAGRTGEAQQGVARLWGHAQLPELCRDYLACVRDLNEDDELRFYPGSPELARRLCRAQDRLQLNEKHPTDGPLLKANMHADERVAVHLGEGWNLAKALLPTEQKRLVLLIDPPYEAVDEYERAVQMMGEALKRMRQAVVLIWYPIKDERQLKRFYQALGASGAPKLLRAELCVHPSDNQVGLNGSGLAIANPPWGLFDELHQLLPWLAEQLEQSRSSWRLDWLIEE